MPTACLDLLKIWCLFQDFSFSYAPSQKHILGCLFIVIFRYSLCGFQGANIKFTAKRKLNGDEEIRTLDPLLARQVLSQLSYIPAKYAKHSMIGIISC